MENKIWLVQFSDGKFRRIEAKSSIAARRNADAIELIMIHLATTFGANTEKIEEFVKYLEKT